uniref:Glycosyl transferase 64 domain-containing protein n=1 Tax=Chaetoceros debilis TaxID=122233 RepID=A0A7S3V700_9STRA
MRRRTKSSGGVHFPPISPIRSPNSRNRTSSFSTATVGVPRLAPSVSNYHFRYRRLYDGGQDNNKLNKATKIEVPKLKCISLWSVLRFIFVLLITNGIFTTVDHMLSQTGIAFTSGDGSKQIVSPEDLSSETIGLVKSKSETFAVVINTFRRPDQLKEALLHYAQSCGVSSDISQIFVIWADQEFEPPKIEELIPEYRDKRQEQKAGKGNLRSSSSGSNSGDEAAGDADAEAEGASSSAASTYDSKFPTIEFIRPPKDSLNSRFLPIDNLQTNAIFMVDDDIRVDCPSLERGFEAWRYHPNSMAGFYPRLVLIQSSTKGIIRQESKINRVYHNWPMVFANHKFNMIMTKASFFHSKYLEMYHDDEKNPKEVLALVDEQKNCEDIAMAFVVAQSTKQSVEIDMQSSRYCRDCLIYTNGNIKDSGLFSGISSGGDHVDKRSNCLDRITEIYAKRSWDYPLLDFDLGDHSWVHHFFWWQYGPSNFFEWYIKFI